MTAQAMEQTVKELYEASVEGSVKRLLGLLHQDSLILNRCTITTYSETPLHIAAMLGHLDFCSKLLSENPGLAKELDSRRSSALHLASAKGYVGIVNMLLSAGPEMCLAYDGDGNNPIHMAAMKGHVDVLDELVKVRPDAAFARVEVRENWTVLHLCIHYYQFEALKFLVEALKDIELINARDYNGNSILHLAVADKQVKTIQYLVGKGEIDVNGLNSNGLTALDILAQTRRDSKYIEIAHSLHLYAARRSSPKSSYNQASLSPISGRHQSEVTSENMNKLVETQDQNSCGSSTSAEWLESQRNSLMVVASLIATMGFQAVIAPPGGFWNEDSKKDEHNNSSDTTNVSYLAGQSILAVTNRDVYTDLVISNTVGFLASLATILLLISGLSFKHESFMWILMVIMWISISATAYTYLLAINAGATEDEIDQFNDAYEFILDGVFALFLLLIMAHTIQFIRQRIIKWSVKKKICLWILMVTLWIIGAVIWTMYRCKYCYTSDILIVACAVFTAFLMLLYAVQMISYIINKVKGWFLRFKSWSSCNSDRTQQV